MPNRVHYPSNESSATNHITCAKQGNTLFRDYVYFQNFYSRPCAYLSSEISKYSDCFDSPKSFLYDEYPDKSTFQYHVDQIFKQLKAPSEELWLKPLIEALLVQEFLYRRSRKS